MSKTTEALSTVLSGSDPFDWDEDNGLITARKRGLAVYTKDYGGDIVIRQEGGSGLPDIVLVIPREDVKELRRALLDELRR